MLQLRDMVEVKLQDKAAKFTVADWLRLAEAERAMMDLSESNDIQVTWITPSVDDVEKVFGPRKRGPSGGRDGA